MRVVCDNCQAVYRIPDEKLVKPVNKATCRSCGHRMLIPRPEPVEPEEEEATVVARSPLLTPAGSRRTPPPTDNRPSSPDDESSAPRFSLRSAQRGPHEASPAPAAKRFTDVEWSYDSPDGEHTLALPGKGDEPEHTTWVKSPTAPSRPSRPAPPPRHPTSVEQHTRPVVPPRPAPSAEAPVKAKDVSRPVPASPNRSAGFDEPPAPPPRAAEQVADRQPIPPPPHTSSSSRGAPQYDPASDFGLALACTVAAILGVSVLGIDFETPLWWANVLIRLFSLTLACGGVLSALFLLLTSDRGRRPAQRGISVGAGSFLGLAFAGLLTIARLGVADSRPPIDTTSPSPADHATLDEGDPEGEPSPTDGTSRPSTDPDDVASENPTEDPDETTASDQEPVSAGDKETAHDPTEDDGVVDAAPAPRRTTPRSSSPRRSSPSTRSTPSPAPVPAPVAAPPQPAPRASSAPTPRTSAPTPPPATDPGIPMEALDVMLRNNLEVKKCFFTYMKATGSLPSRVDVRFTLEANGRVSSLAAVQPEFTGTELDQCLGTAIRAIQFPPSGSATKITYPYIFQ